MYSVAKNAKTVRKLNMTVIALKNISCKWNLFYAAAAAAL